MNNLLCKTFVMGALICSTQLSAQKVSDKQPWSVRMVESEMIRCPESWQLDFQPKLKWDYCHGLELQAMLVVYFSTEKVHYLFSPSINFVFRVRERVFSCTITSFFAIYLHFEQKLQEIRRKKY